FSLLIPPVNSIRIRKTVFNQTALNDPNPYNLLQKRWVLFFAIFGYFILPLAVINMIKDLPGRKSILLISDGLPSLASKKMKSITIRTSTYTVHMIPAAGYGPKRVSDHFNIIDKKGIMRGEDVIKELIGFANAQNISIYTLDPETFTEYFFTDAAESDSLATLLKKQEKMNQVQSLRRISEDTGAAWLRGAKKYDVFRQVISTDLNCYYQLSFYPQRKKADNRYHKIRVKVKRKGVDLRFRKGYTDYSEEQAERMLLVAAYYSPSLYKAIPFEAEFIPFHKDSNKYEPWMNIALPVKKLFMEREVAYGLKRFNLHVWVKEKERGDKAFGGKTTVTFNIDTSFMDFIKGIDYLCYHFKGPELEFADREYEAIFALYDEQSEEIGTWESTFTLPDFKDKEQGSIINCVLGLLTSNPEGAEKSFSLSRKDGTLEYGGIKFYPAVTNRFQRMQDASVFLQAYLPGGKVKVNAEFTVLREGRVWQEIRGEKVAEAWNRRSKVWCGIFKLNMRGISPGDYTLRVNLILSEGGPVLSKEVRLTKLRY
ncbi:MAG: VWA domain-containing protein, partial [Candidatus Aminicenantales bacterium]